MLFEEPISKEDAAQATIYRARDMGSTTNTIFYLKVVNLILSILLVVWGLTNILGKPESSYSSSYPSSYQTSYSSPYRHTRDRNTSRRYSRGSSLNTGSLNMAQTDPSLRIISYILTLGFGIAEGILLRKMGGYFEDFKKAGTFYMVSAATSFIPIGAGIFAILYCFKYTNAMKESLYGISSSLSRGWEIMSLIYKIILISMIPAIMFIAVSFLRTLVLLYMILLILAAPLIGIYEFVLLKMSANAFKRFGNKESVAV